MSARHAEKLRLGLRAAGPPVCAQDPGDRAAMGAPRDIGAFVVWDYVVFAGMLLISAVIGIYYAFAGGGQQTSKDFLMGGRRMTAVPVALSLTASFMSAVTVLGTPSEVYRFGAIFSIFAITYFLVVVLSAEVFLPVFYKLGITSTYEVKGEGVTGRVDEGRGGLFRLLEEFSWGQTNHHIEISPRSHPSLLLPSPFRERCSVKEGKKILGLNFHELEGKERLLK